MEVDRHPMTEPASAPNVELRGVHKSFGPHHILRGIDLEVAPRETMVIIGRSGTGKSVLLRHIVGLMQPDAGQVRVFGECLSGRSRKEISALGLRMGFLFQSGALLNWMTIEENVALPLTVHRRKLSAAEVEQRVVEKLSLVGMESARKKLPGEISGGMKKRAALARATILDPEIVLYDEPTSGLDPVISNNINDLINRTAEVLGTTQIVVTHDMESAYQIADRIAMLYEGRVIALETPDGIRNSDNEIVQQFIHGRTEGPLTVDTLPEDDEGEREPGEST